MARRPYGYARYEEPQTQVAGVPYISLYDPNEVERLALLEVIIYEIKKLEVVDA